MGLILAVVGAIVLHLAFITFGGLVVGGGGDPVASAKTREVELLSETEELEQKEEEKKPEETVADEDEMEVETEEAPDAAELLRSLDLSPAAAAPALDAASLNSISNALLGQGGAGGDFGAAFNFASGGRIGGTGKAGGLGDGLDQAFSLAEIDQKPRPIFQSTPLYPSSMRGRKVECVVTLVFVVDASGKVVSPKVEKSGDPAFNQPALDAVKRWKFEPAVRGGQRVSCRMRAPLRFKPS
jgi:protein TonB